VNRIITKAEELDGLADLSVIVDNGTDVWQKRGEHWCSYETSFHDSKRLVKYAPLELIWEPKS
jgi:hypothetical protein